MATTENGPKIGFLKATRSFFNRNSASANSNGEEDKEAVESESSESNDSSETGGEMGRPTTKWSLGILNVPTTHEVPGSVMLLSDHRNHPLGLRHVPAVTSSSSLPPQIATPIQSRRSSRQEVVQDPKKTTPDGAIILDPQPEETNNDPLNWPKWRRDAALLSLGIYCMVGGGMTPILAAGFSDVAETYAVTVPKVALTTGLYMMGLGVGSVFASPTAILYGKRPVYLFSAVVFVATSIWCAASPSYISLLVARIFQGISVSSVECLPSATIAEIFFLHERAYRIGIYTLLLLGGKNLVPLVSAAIIQSMGWRWVFWIVAIVVGFCGMLLFLFVPESFWDRTPQPKARRPSQHSRSLSRTSLFSPKRISVAPSVNEDEEKQGPLRSQKPQKPPLTHRDTTRSVGFADGDAPDLEKQVDGATSQGSRSHRPSLAHHDFEARVQPAGGCPPTPDLHNINSPTYTAALENSSTYMPTDGKISKEEPHPAHEGKITFQPDIMPHSQRYTRALRQSPPLSFVQQMKPFRGRLSNDRWFRVALRPFILFAYPAVLWSAGVYACAVGWLIVLSESVSEIYRKHDTYNFSALSTGLIYISPFIGGVLGTAVAGKVSDVIVRAMTKRNGGLYEPEFRLVMGLPITITTVAGLMGYGWSAQERDAWIVPTVFFGIISFGCSLASTTAITFCVDSYRQYAGEALVTLNFSKNIFHGLVFSLFFNHWLEADGSRTVFIWLGVIQLVLMGSTIPMYIFGKRARMWTVKMNFMEKF
ncbi:hypothetical protein HYFRA_00005550 [Hymenoscyphus fraxineus]|uniref:Major facilitator superfamily (MFS) profile domain-containing protein n=1 Tax=Hymenoscyphus fraxineus TaxID=746836 RepID=A0A9N9KS93_9HELO|nr:hypothetical protein HYFRA_00005550 [Hymenoscyphus fraxineus]